MTASPRPATQRRQPVAGLLAVVAALGVGHAVHAQSCVGDLNHDGRIDGGDLGTVLSWWGPVVTSVPMSQACDLNADGSVDGVDLGLVLGDWGVCQASITEIVPVQGRLAGGTEISIHGTQLSQVSAVTVGGVPCTGLTLVSPNMVRAWTPAGPAGEAEIQVTTPAGTVTAPVAFTYREVVVPSWATLIEVQPDPAVVTDSAFRAAIAATGYAWRVRDTATQVEMLLVPPGTFDMGCTIAPTGQQCRSFEKPAHPVTLTQPYYLGRYEVTQAQWTARMASNPSYWQAANHPVESVSWNAVQEFCSSTGMRLPTEAEWEHACRAGTQTPYYNGSADSATVVTLAWHYYNACSGTSVCSPRDVGQLAPNALGFRDMLGNVSEWVNDRYGLYSAGAQTDPTGSASASDRVIRGGSFNFAPASTCSSTRDFRPPDHANNGIGFRVARTP